MGTPTLHHRRTAKYGGVLQAWDHLAGLTVRKRKFSQHAADGVAIVRPLPQVELDAAQVFNIIRALK